MLSDNNIIGKLTQKQKEELADEANKKYKEKLKLKASNAQLKSSLNVSQQTIKMLTDGGGSQYDFLGDPDPVETPWGTWVDAYTGNEDMSQEDYKDRMGFVADEFPLASVLGDPCYYYNCHSYAWYEQSTSNQHWIMDPSKYMTDQNSIYDYVGTYPTPSYDNQKAYYPNGSQDHSAIVIDFAYPGNGDYDAVTVVSKWGAYPLMYHPADYCPYDSSIIEFYQ